MPIGDVLLTVAIMTLAFLGEVAVFSSPRRLLKRRTTSSPKNVETRCTLALAGLGFLRSHRGVIAYHPRLYFGPCS
jgi:hypothetical protein